MKFKKKKPGRIAQLKQHIKTHKADFIVYSVLRLLVILTMILSIIYRRYENAALCLLSLILLLLPAFIESNFGIEIPSLLEAIVYCFIFASEILGEINSFYVTIPGWDTMLHTLNGFLCAAVGFSLIDLLNRNSRNLKLSPLYLTIVAFCFSMTVGVMWEFFEFGMDKFFLMDMQKDTIVTSFASVKLNPDNLNKAVIVRDIVSTVITTADGQIITVSGGYLDIGIVDTMKDLFVNFIGAVAFSIIGYSYVNSRDKSGLAKKLIPTVARQDDEDATDDEPAADDGKPTDKKKDNLAE